MSVRALALAALASITMSSAALAQNYGQTRSIIVVGGKFTNPGSKVALNPQPLPPRESRFSGSMSRSGVAASRMLNPQPLPPKYLFGR